MASRSKVETGKSHRNETASRKKAELLDEKADSLDWDDDDFELSEVQLSTTVSEKNAIITTQEDGLVANDDDWLKPPSEVTSSECSATTDGVYLTDQFKKLNTPASRKKPRCSACTRPLRDGRKSLLCHRCTKENPTVFENLK